MSKSFLSVFIPFEKYQSLIIIFIRNLHIWPSTMNKVKNLHEPFTEFFNLNSCNFSLFIFWDLQKNPKNVLYKMLSKYLSKPVPRSHWNTCFKRVIQISQIRLYPASWRKKTWHVNQTFLHLHSYTNIHIWAWMPSKNPHTVRGTGGRLLADAATRPLCMRQKITRNSRREKGAGIYRR